MHRVFKSIQIKASQISLSLHYQYQYSCLCLCHWFCRIFRPFHSVFFFLCQFSSLDSLFCIFMILFVIGNFLFLIAIGSSMQNPMLYQCTPSSILLMIFPCTSQTLQMGLRCHFSGYFSGERRFLEFNFTAPARPTYG